jgi:hypothetical protein
MKMLSFKGCIIIVVTTITVGKAETPGCDAMTCKYPPGNQIMIGKSSVTPDCACAIAGTQVVFTPANSVAYFDIFRPSPFSGNLHVIAGNYPVQTSLVGNPVTFSYMACYLASAAQAYCPDPKLIVKPVNPELMASVPLIDFEAARGSQKLLSPTVQISTISGNPAPIFITIASNPDIFQLGPPTATPCGKSVSGCTFTVAFNPPSQEGTYRAVAQISNGPDGVVTLSIPISGTVK